MLLLIGVDGNSVSIRQQTVKTNNAPTGHLLQVFGHHSLIKSELQWKAFIPAQSSRLSTHAKKNHFEIIVNNVRQTYPSLSDLSPTSEYKSVGQTSYK